MGIFGRGAVRANESGVNAGGAGATRRGVLSGAVGVTALLFTTGLIGISAAAAATNKPVVGVGIRACKRPGGNRRIAPIPTDAAGRFIYTASEAGNYDVEIIGADLQRGVNAIAAQEQAEATATAATQRRLPGAAVAVPTVQPFRLVVIRFAPGTRVTAPNGQVAVTGHPNTFVVNVAPQTFSVAVPQGGSISATVETLDLTDLLPAAQIAAATATATTARGASAGGNRGDLAVGRLLGFNSSGGSRSVRFGFRFQF